LTFSVSFFIYKFLFARDVEKKDVTRVLEIHIFITQFFHKFDLRTTMLVSARGLGTAEYHSAVEYQEAEDQYVGITTDMAAILGSGDHSGT
jgi:hypothetical protein